MKDPVCAFGKVSKLSCELLGLFHRESLAMSMPGVIDQQTNALDVIIGHTNSHPVGVYYKSKHSLYRLVWATLKSIASSAILDL